MRTRLLLVITIWSLLWAPATSGGVEEAKEAVGAVLDSLHQAASDADSALYFSLFAADAVFMGTDATERWSVAEFKVFAEPYFSQGRGWTYVARERHVSVATDGATAWFDEVLWNESYGTCRGSGVLVHTDGRWRISQYNLTIPIPNELARKVAGRIKEFEAAAAAGTIPAQEPLVVYLVRHAEKVDDSYDPELSAAGKERAEKLAEVLRDAGIFYVHSTDFLRTRNTAAPLAGRLGLKVELYKPGDLATLVAQLRTTGGRHLVVGHSNSTPAAVELLGGDPGSAIDTESEYDRLYVVTSASDGTVSTVLVRFGRHFGGDAG